MNNIIKTLIIDDHPIIISAYINILKLYMLQNTKIQFKISTATSIQDTVQLIDNNKDATQFDLILLDICLPHCNESKFNSGEDLGLFLKEKTSNSKIVAITSLNDNHRLWNVLQTLNPEGLLIKSDLDNEILVLAIKNVISGNTYYSATVVNLLRNRISNKLILDELDIKLLHELSNGSKMKELQQFLPLTKSGIEKRKRALKEKLKIKGDSDRALILEAKQKGFI